MRWLLPLLALCLAVGLAASWMLDEGTTAPPAGPGGAPAAGADRGPAPEAATGATADDDLFESDRLAAEVDAEVDRKDGAPVATTGTASILVVRGDPPQPVADADVYFLSERDLALRNRESDQRISRWDGPELFGQRTRTDAAGLATLPRGRDRWFCSATKDGEFGFVAAPPRDRQYTLSLQPDEQFEIVATHPDGSPAAVPLGVLKENPGRGGRNAEPIWRGHSDAAGRALVRHFQLVRGDGGPEPERFAALALVPSDPPCLTEFAGRPVEAPIVELVVAPLGSVEITLVDHAGKPLLSPASIGFGFLRSEQRDGAMTFHGGLLSQRADKPRGAEPVLMPFVAVGTSIQAYARYPHDRRPARSGETGGPAASDDVVQLTIPLHDRHCVFAGRLLGTDQRPIVMADVDVTLWRDDEAQQTARIYTIDDGRWDLVQTGSSDQARWTMELRYRHEPSGDDVPAAWLGARIPLPAWPPGQRIELGDIVLGELPPLVAGVVVDDLGQPVVNANITVQQERVTAARPPSRGRGSTMRIDLTVRENGRVASTGNAGPQRSWRNLPQLRTRTATDGSFALAGPLPPGNLRVQADTDRHFADAVPLPTPNQNLRIRIDRNGIVRGVVLLPPWVPDDAVTVTLQPFDESQRESSTRRDGVSAREIGRGRFRIEPLRSGRYDCVVTMRNLQRPLATVPDVFVTPGETVDVRLRPLDLRESLFRYRLRALDQAGSPMTIDGPIHARLQQLDGSFVEAGFRWRNGSAELITAHQMAELTFFGRGFEPQRRQLGPGDHDIYLRTLQPALVQVPGAHALCGGIRKVRISVVLEGDTGLPGSLAGIDQSSGRRFSFPRWDLGRSSGAWLEDQDVVSIPLMQAGTYEVILRAHATESTNSPQVSISLGKHELKPDGVSMTTVTVDALALTEALKQVDEQYQQRLAQRAQRRRGR